MKGIDMIDSQYKRGLFTCILLSNGVSFIILLIGSKMSSTLPPDIAFVRGGFVGAALTLIGAIIGAVVRNHYERKRNYYNGPHFPQEEESQ
jgi:hypothetical protein